MRRAIALAVGLAAGGLGFGASSSLRIPSPRRQIEIIGELAKWPILPILPPMFGAAGPRLDVGTAIGAAASRRPAGRVCVPQ
jgi:hypothetical protein